MSQLNSGLKIHASESVNLIKNIPLLSGNIEQKPGIFIADIQEGSVVSLDGRLQKYDRILFINGQDVREVELSQASALIQVKYGFLFSF